MEGNVGEGDDRQKGQQARTEIKQKKQRPAEEVKRKCLVKMSGGGGGGGGAS